MPASHPDIVLIGGGVVGLTTALKLAEDGVSVALLDRQSTGREASWAGAGMLPPGNLANAATPEARLRSYSHSLWPEFAAALIERTGIDIGYHACGAIEVSSPETRHEFQQHCQQWQEEGIRVESLSEEEVYRHVADLDHRFDGGIFLPDFAQVRNPRYLQALKAACLQRGVEILEHVEILEFRRESDRIAEVRTDNRVLHLDKICFTAGAWTTALLQPLGFSIPIKPVRGQIVQLQLPAQPFRCVIELGRRYLVPRRDGLILVGSTEEDVGFAKHTTTGGIDGLLEFAKSLVPSLAYAEVVMTWAGLRPRSPDELPLLGPVSGLSNAFIGAGHFRSGLQMSPATGRILADLLLHREPEICLDGLTSDRFSENYNFQSPAPQRQD
ncbi:MAG TPA: glycine oxidase ThiO [Planctomycetaceae bacterium]|nr:glycine oxidase ThiO [Planctomycetaceae bacterium]